MSPIRREASEQPEFDRYYGDPDRAPPVPDAAAADPSASRRWCNSLSWPLFISLGLIAFELTAQPVLGAFIVFSKLGWEDLLTACWLRRMDPDRRRARACFYLYVAAGAWKIAVISWIAIPVLGLVVLPFFPAWKVLTLAILEAMCGLALFTSATMQGVALAWRNGTPVWVSPNVHRARVKKIWPPPASLVGGKNQGLRLLVTAVFVGSVVACMVLGNVLITAAGIRAGGLEVLTGFFALGNLIAAAIMAWIPASTLRRIIARKPADCWPESEVPPPAVAIEVVPTSQPSSDARGVEPDSVPHLPPQAEG